MWISDRLTGLGAYELFETGHPSRMPTYATRCKIRPLWVETSHEQRTAKRPEIAPEPLCLTPPSEGLRR